jgi:hypothetical protein
MGGLLLIFSSIIGFRSALPTHPQIDKNNFSFRPDKPHNTHSLATLSRGEERTRALSGYFDSKVFARIDALLRNKDVSTR